MAPKPPEIIVSRQVDRLIETAKEAYTLSLISAPTLARVVERALTIPGYDPCLDFGFGRELFPYPWEIREARSGSL